MEKRTIKFVISLMLLLSFTITTMTGCGSPPAPSGNDATTAEASGSTAAGNTENSSGVGIPLSGTGSSPEDPLFDPALNLTLTMYTTNMWSEDSKPDNKMVQDWIEARTGLKLNWVYTALDNYADKMNLMFLSGESFDGFTQGNITRPPQQMLDDNITVDLKPYMEVYGKNFQRLLSDGFSYVEGKNKEILALPKRVSNHRGYTPVIRGDWAKEAGLSGLPTTIADYEKYMDYVLKNDVNHNGDPNDEIPLMPQGLTNLLMHYEGVFLGAEGIGDNYEADGVVSRDVTHPNYMAFLDKMREWYEKKYIYPEFFVVTSAQIQDMISADRVGGYNYWYSNVVRPFEKVETADPNKTYEILPNLQSPIEGVQSVYSEDKMYQPVIYASASSKHPELVVAYFDWMISDPAIDITVWNGIEGTHWEWYNKETLTYRVLPGAADRYFKGFQCVCQWEPEKQFVNVYPETYVAKRYAFFLKQLNDPAKDYAEAFDLKVPYTKIGTPLENMGNDAATLLDESRLKYIIGEIDRDAMVKAIEQYKEMYGNTYSEVYTKQYSEYLSTH